MRPDRAIGARTGPLAGAFPLLSLRTNKADVAVGVPEAIAAALDARGEKWRTSGRCVFFFYVRVLVEPGLWLADGPLVACVQVRAGVLLASGRTAGVNLWISWMPGRASSVEMFLVGPRREECSGGSGYLRLSRQARLYRSASRMSSCSATPWSRRARSFRISPRVRRARLGGVRIW